MPKSTPSTVSTPNASQVVDYLSKHPQFLHEHPQVMTRLELPQQVGHNTVSLHAKQVKVLKESLAQHETQLAVLLKNAANSESITKSMHQLTLCLLAQRTVSGLPLAGSEALGHLFGLQDSAVRLWGVEDNYLKLPCADAVSEDIKTFADGLKQPYCGPNANFTPVQWLQRPVASVAMMALRVTPNASAFGLFVIGSQDATRFTRDKSTDLLAQLGQVFSASYGRMLPPFS